MIKPKDGEMNYDSIDELKWNYMFIAACLTDEQKDKLKKEWDKQGDYKKTEWWRFVMENTKIGLDLNLNKGD